jgi:hypothetical protein
LIVELFRSTLNPLGEEILTGLISGTDREMAGKMTIEHPQLLPSLFRAKPGLATASHLWSTNQDRTRELFESVAAYENWDSATVAGIVEALLASNSDAFIKRAFDRRGKDAIFPALDWTEGHSGAMSEMCRGALTFYVPVVMDWVEARPTDLLPKI